MYESPIEIISSGISYQVVEEYERQIIKAVQSYDIKVDKEELVKALNYDRQQYKKGYRDAEQQRWMPCSERLPEESGRYLVTRGLKTTGPLWNRVYIANYSDLMGIKSEKIWWQGNVGKSDFERLDDVVSWMPLPEPYKGERREKE